MIQRIKGMPPYLVLAAILGVASIMGCSKSTDNDNDTIAPTVSATIPVDAATDVAINNSITATFSEEMDPLTITSATFTLEEGATAVAGTVAYAGITATFTPTGNLSATTVHTATITTGAMDLAGNALESAYVWSFTTGAVPDTEAPTVTSTFPTDSATDVAINSNITATFSEAMTTATIVAANFTVVGEASETGTVTYDLPNRTAIFAPANNLAYATTYTATITTGAEDLAGNALTPNKVWTFTTASLGAGPAPVSLGTAGNYVILAKTAITNVPTSAITGDLGLSPAAESYITGFSLTDATGYATSAQVTGFIYAADMAPPTPTSLTTAISNMETAYTDAAGRPTPDFTNLGTGDIGGQTLVPGLYNWTSAVTIPADVTINGGANDVWIFQISGDLTVSSAVSVLLSGGAQAKNIFWQVAGETILGANAHFEGIILCQTAITMQTGASMNGRALAQSQVALDQNAVTKPAH